MIFNFFILYLERVLAEVPWQLCNMITRSISSLKEKFDFRFPLIEHAQLTVSLEIYVSLYRMKNGVKSFFSSTRFHQPYPALFLISTSLASLEKVKLILQGFQIVTEEDSGKMSQSSL